MTAPKTVYRAANSLSGRQPKLHLHEDCQYAQNANNLLEKPFAAYPDWVPHCSNCWPDDRDALVV